MDCVASVLTPVRCAADSGRAQVPVSPSGPTHSRWALGRHGFGIEELVERLMHIVEGAIDVVLLAQASALHGGDGSDKF